MSDTARPLSGESRKNPNPRAPDLRSADGVEAGFGTMSDDIYIGYKETWGGEQPFGLSTAHRRHHLYVIGKTGSGKTTLLRNLLVQQIAAGHGVGLLDPHGDLAEELLDHIPPRRADDLVYFNPSDLEHPIGLNLLANVPPDARHLVASGIVSAFKSIWRDSWGPRLEYILYNCLAALLDCQNTTLLGVVKMLVDPRYRRWVVQQSRDPLVRLFWFEEFAKYDARFMREAVAPIQNKIGQFLMNAPVRNILGQVRRKIDLRFMMDDGRILIANLSKGKLGEEKANLLGSLLTTQFQLAAMQRSEIPEAQRHDFFLFIDEFHNFTTDSFAAILAEARKYRLCLTLSHQYIDQLSPVVRPAVFGNVGTIISFRVGHADAEALAGEFGVPYHPGVFTDLNRYEILVKRAVENTTETFHATTLPPVTNRIGRRENLIRRSREKYATPRSVVEEKIRRWLGSK
jgi:hypothetical protein